jgi:hypothetical protein
MNMIIDDVPTYFTNKHALSITLRDYFAAKALQGLLANSKLQKEILEQGGCMSGWIEGSAYGFADAMMKAREEQ